MSATNGLDVAPIVDAEIETVAALWERCGLTRPWNDPQADIAFARKSANAAVLVGRRTSTIAATVVVGHDGHRGWVYYLAVEPAMQGQGLGSAMMAAAEGWLRERGVPKLMLMVRPDNVAVCSFYERLGYADQPRAIYAKWLDGREPTP